MKRSVFPSGSGDESSARRSAPAPVWVAAAAAISLLAGCRREEVTHARVPKLPQAAGESAAGGGGAPGMLLGRSGGAADVPAPPAPSGAGALRWTLPKGWAEAQAGGMRFATLRAPVSGKVDVSVVVLPGPAGGELANVNRWRGQIGLSPLDEAALASSRRTLRTRAGEVSLYDFTSEGQSRSRLVAGLLEANGNSWFVKMVGDAGPVGAARPDFIRLLETLRFEQN